MPAGTPVAPELGSRPTVDLDAHVRAALAGAPEPHALLDAGGRLRWVNAAWTELTGWAEAEVVGRLAAEFVTAGDGEIGFEGGATHQLRTRDDRWIRIEWRTASEPRPGALGLGVARPWTRLDTGDLVDGSPGPSSSIADVAGIGRWSMDRVDRTFSMSPATCAMLGLAGLGPHTPFDELWAFLRRSEAPELEIGLLRLASATVEVDLRVPVRLATGELRFVRLAGRPHGRLQGMQGLAVDVTHATRREAELGERAQAAEATLARFNALLGLGRQAASSFSELYQGYAEVGCAYTGLASGGVFTRLGGELRASPSGATPIPEPVEAQLQRAIDEGQPIAWCSSEPPLRAVLAAPIRARSTIRGLLAFFGSSPPDRSEARDLEFVALAATALGRAIETLEGERHTRYQRGLFEGLFRQTPDGILLESAPRRRVLMVNEALCRILGRSRESLEAEPADGILDVDLPATGSGPCSAVLRRPDGSEVAVEIVSQPIVDERKDTLAIMRHVRDVSLRHRIETMKEAFVAVASHELRTPLTAVTGSLSLLREIGDDLPEDVRDLLDIAYRSSDRLRLLVDDILDMQRLESGAHLLRRELRDVRALVEDALGANAGIAQTYGVRFMLQPGPPCWGMVDERRIAQVLANLLSNAAKHAPAQSEITVSVRPESSRLAIDVQDRGPGIPEAFRPRVFERFTQAHASAIGRTAGSGLGLSITRTLVEQHGGEVGFDCPPDGGTIFTVRLPASSPECVR